MTDDLFQVLGVQNDASQQEIDAAFQNRREVLSRAVDTGSADAESQLRLLTMAYGILGDPEKRKAYNKIHRAKQNAHAIQQRVAASELSTRDDMKEKATISEKKEDRNGVVNSFFQGRYGFLKILLLGIVAPVVVLALISPPKLVSGAMVLWYIVVGFVLFRSAAKYSGRIARWAARALSVLIVVWNSLVLVGGLMIYGSSKSTTPVALLSDDDPGCLSMENLLLDVLTARPADIQKDKEFLSTPEGRFLDAALKGKIDDVKALLDGGVDINTRDKRGRYSGNNAMHHAARTNNVELATFLLNRGMDIDAPGPTGYSALHVASGLGKLKMVSFLIGKGAKLSQYDSLSRGTPLEIAIIQGRARTVELLIRNGALRGVTSGTEAPLTALSRAASICPSHAKVVQAFIDAGADLNVKDSSGRPIFLALAARNNDVAMVLAKGPMKYDWITPVLDGRVVGNTPRPPIVSLSCSEGGAKAAQYLMTRYPDHQTLKRAATGAWGTPLNCASGSKYNLEMFRFLLDQGFDLNAVDQNGKTPLHRELDAEVVEFLFKRGSNVNARDNEGKTPLHYASFEGMVTKLVELGANVNLVDNRGRSPIFENSDSIKTNYLLAHGAKLDLRDTDGRTPLLYWLSRRDMTRGMMAPFMNNGADIRVFDNLGATAIHYAARHSDSDTTSLLLSLYKDGGLQKDTSGRTPLHYAARNRFIGVAESLVNAGADINAQDKDGDTPLHVAAAQGNHDFVVAAIKLGAKLTISNKEGEKPVDLAPKDSSFIRMLSDTR